MNSPTEKHVGILAGVRSKLARTCQLSVKIHGVHVLGVRNQCLRRTIDGFICPQGQWRFALSSESAALLIVI